MSLEPQSVSEIRYNCSACSDALFPEIYQCQNGHLVCQNCIHRLVTCTVCLVDLMPSMRVRNVEIERIIRLMEHPCPRKDDGCNAVLKYGQLKDHELECEYNKFTICNIILGNDCDEMRITDFPQHMETAHGHKCFDIPGNPPLAMTSHYGSCILSTLKQRHTGLFRLRFGEKLILGMMIVEHNNASGLITWTPYILSGGLPKNQIFCKITFYTNGTIKAMLKSPVMNLKSDTEDLQTCLSLPLQYVNFLLATSSATDGNEGKYAIDYQFYERAENLLNEPVQLESTADDQAKH